MQKLNWGVIGLGNIAQKFLEGFFDVRNSNILAVASRNPVKLSKFKNQFKIEDKFLFNNYDDLIHCKDVDIIYISLPNFLHYEWIVKCFENKKKVLVEKPATLNFFEAQELEKIIKKNDLFFSEGFMYRYDPQIQRVIELIKNNEIGNVLSMESSFGVNILTKKKFIFFEKKRKINKNSRQFSKQFGGGCILDLGCYPTSFSLLVSSLVKNIEYKNFKLINLEREIGETGVDIDSKAEIVFGNSFISKVKASFKKNLGNNTIIRGDKGDIIVNNTFLGINDIKIVLKDKTYVIKNTLDKNIFSYEIENISKSVLSGLKQTLYPGMKIEETLLNMKILDSWKND
jgi:predicted dehydrogenase